MKNPNAMSWKVRRSIAVIIAIAAALSSLAGVPPVGSRPPQAALVRGEGGRLDGEEWHSEELAGRTWVVFYVRPTQSEWFDPLYDSLFAAHFPTDLTGSILVLNMANSIIPEPVVKQIVRAKQRKYSSTDYLVDRRKVLARRWGLPSDTSCVMLIDQNGSVLYSRTGPVDSLEASFVVRAVWENIRAADRLTQADALDQAAPEVPEAN